MCGEREKKSEKMRPQHFRCPPLGFVYFQGLGLYLFADIYGSRPVIRSLFGTKGTYTGYLEADRRTRKIILLLTVPPSILCE